MATPTLEVRQGLRLASIDMLRGSVMIVMAIDHVRDFFHHDAALFSPTDLARTTPILFLTRWTTHFCLPVFMFSAGIGMYLWQERGRTRAELSRFLFTRGLWFMLLELTVMQFAYNFNVSDQYLDLSLRLLATLSLAVIALHNLFDGVKPSRFASAAWAWNLLHQPGVIPFAGRQALTTYTLLPWIGVMAAGFCLGRCTRWSLSRGAE